ncbi:MAG: hypothetical protein IJX08_05770, partial [Clostridia bacterium]|nr:hypothetical protein [Clostridia bacterium]
MSIYQMSAEERAQRAQEARARREERYTLAEYMRAQKRQEEERQRAIRQAQVEEENKIKSANPLLRAISTTGDIGANVTTGALKSLEGIVDLGAGIVGAVGGLASKDFREGTKKFISKDYTGEYVGKPLDELTKYSYLNTMPGGNIAEGVASGVGQMLPTVAITLLTGGTGTAPSLAGQAASTAGQAAATAGQVASKVGQVANMAYLTTSAAGNATESAYQDGADFYKGLGYGAASGALEGVTEKITGGFGGIVGKGLLDDVGKSLAKSTVGRVAKEAVGEGAEEVLAELANPALKSIYKGRDAFKEYGELDYWKGVGEAGLTGAGTSLVYGGTVGHGVKKKTGVNDAVTASLEDLEEITQRRKAFNVSGTRDETREAVLGRQAAQDYRQIEEVLKKSDASYREKVLSNYGLTDLFESDGSMKEELREQVERSFAPERAVVRDEQGNERELSRLDHRYSMLQDGKASTRIEAEEALRRSEATISSGELSATEAANLKKVRSFIGRLSDRGLVRSNLVVADMAGEDNGAVFGNTIVLNRKQLSKEDGWARTLIHEVEHLTEGTEEWETLAHFLLSSGNSDPAFEAVARNYFKGDETVGESALAKFRAEGGTFAELNEQEQLFLTELIAHETEVLFGSERMLKRLAKEKRSLAKRLLERIEDFFRILKMNKEERKAFVKLETARGYLEKALWAAGDARKKGDSVTENDESVVEKGDYVVSNEMNATTIHKNMNEKERYLILKDKTIHIHNSKSETEYVDDIVALQQLHPKAKSSAEKIIKPLVNKLGITTKMLSSPPVEIDFNYSMGNGLKESLSKQLRYGGNYNDFAHALINIDEILKNAVLIEIHDDKYKGTTREDEHLQSVYVLFSAIRHNETIVPVQMEIKESSDVGGRLSMLVTMTKIEADVLGSTPDINQAHSLISASTHSIAEIFKKINPADKHFLKYLPNNFLSKEQIIAKQEALKEDYDRISKYPKKSKADADFESFSAEDFFYEAEREKRLAEMDLKNMLPNREKSESAEKVPQRKKLTETKFEKSQIRGEITAA